MSNVTTATANQPVQLLPVHIPKPWGQEIWYSGMEVRGESQVALDGQNIDLSDYLARHPDAIHDQPLLLLKVLDPKPQAVTGDLYFEVHEQKQEVYVVTHIDPEAWPDGHGQIRFGMNQSVRQRYQDDDAFRSAYRSAVGEYEQIRRQIDALRDQQAEVEQPLIDAEAQAREVMDGFTALRALAVGDVVKVPTWTPHALQHGVRVVEFQTQTYERYIVSFAQKVLTQNHWDTDHALAHMHLDAPAIEAFEQVGPGIERIAHFDDFNVWRCDGSLAGAITLPEHIPYAVAMALGNTRIGDLALTSEQACLIPHGAIAQTRIQADQQLLLAAPEL